MRDRCPCGTGRPLAACCGPRLSGDAPATTAEELMRSRYAAHVLGDVAYLLATHDPETRGEVDPAAAARWARESEWLGLTVLGTEGGGPGDEAGVVGFVARLRDRSGREQEHRERSRFRRLEGRWYYRDGVPLPPERVETLRAAPRPGRNDPCPCGSGKKHKRCCG